MKIKILKRKKILGAVQKLPAKQHSQSSPIWVKMGWIGCAIQQVTSKPLPQFFLIFSGYIFLNDFIKNPQTRYARAFLPLNISAVGSVTMSGMFKMLICAHCVIAPAKCFSSLKTIFFFLSSQIYRQYVLCIRPSMSVKYFTDFKQQLCKLWQYGLWSFQAGGTKLERFLHKKQYTPTPWLTLLLVLGKSRVKQNSC